VKDLDESTNKSPVIRNDMFGRLDIYSSLDEITAENVLGEVNSAMVYHLANMFQEDFLYWYTRGVQPILKRKKNIREDILNIVQVNTAAEIVDFKDGYLLQKPCAYIARRKGVQTKIKKLNEYLYRSGKGEADNKTADWFHRVGKGVTFVEPNDDNDTPFKSYALDPRAAFVVYSLKPGNKPVMGVNFVTNDGVARFDVFTEKQVFHLSGTMVGKMSSTLKNHDFMVTATAVDSVEPNVLGRIPIIEYRYNSVNTAAFELAIPLLDELSNLASNACDGVEQFIQSLAIAVNCEFPADTTITDIRKAGMIALRSVGENKADFKVLSEQLDQTQTKVLVDSLREEVLRICAMPNRSNGGSTYDTTGAAILASYGWYQADCSARNTEDLFRESNRQFDRIVVEILRRKGLLDINLNDFELNFPHGETANVQSKAQAFQTLMAAGLHPELAAEKSGISSDPVKDMKMSEEYLKMIWGDPSKVDEAEQTNGGDGEATIVESDNDNGENETGGAI
jgi:SPP1 family phage portal protein